MPTLFETFRQDVHYAVRTIRNSPVFAASAVLVLALGIGGNTAIFSVIRAVLLEPLAYRNPDRLVYFSVDNPRHNIQDGSFTPAEFDEIKKSTKSFAGVGAWGRPDHVALSGAGEPEALKAARVSAGFLNILGLRPLIGRDFLPEEDRRGGRPAAIISSALWKRKFSGDPRIVGKTATLDSTAYTIVGVLPDGFEFPFAGVDVWLTRPSEWSLLPPRFWGLVAILTGFGRLRPGVTLEQAYAEMNVLQRRYDFAHPSPLNANGSNIMRVLRLKDRLVADIRPMLWTLFGAVGFVLLIACANVASLLLARAGYRSREFAVRAALGAARGRLVRQVLAESIVLAAAGGGLGIVFARWGLSAITGTGALSISARVNAPYLPGAGHIGFDPAVLGFAVLLSVATGILFGLAPSLQASRPDLAAVLGERGAGTTMAGRRTLAVSTRSLLVAGQIALSIVLLTGAVLLIRSFVRLRTVDPGFQPLNLLTAKIALPLARYDTDQKRYAFYRDLLPRVEDLPRVRAAAFAMSLPATNWIRTNIGGIQGKPPLDPSGPPWFAVAQNVTPGYFRTLRIPLIRGREFSDHDNAPGAPHVIIINQTLARRLWPEYPLGENPVGQHISEGYDKNAGWMEVLGIVADVREGGLAAGPVPEFYVPCALNPPQTAFLVVRTDGGPLRAANAVRAAVRAVDRDQPVSDLKTMEAALDSALGQRRLTTLLLALFAGVALVLAVVGIYGVMAYAVAQRTQEMGIRRALGAQESDILSLVLKQAFAVAAGGAVVGTASALALTRVMGSLLFHTSPTDLATLAGVPLLFVIVALAAAYLPARRAATVDPAETLRVG